MNMIKLPHKHNVATVRAGLPSWPLELMTRGEIARAAHLVGRLTINECTPGNIGRARQPQAAAELTRLLATLQTRAKPLTVNYKVTREDHGIMKVKPRKRLSARQLEKRRDDRIMIQTAQALRDAKVI